MAIGKWQKIPTEVQQGMLKDVKSFGIKSPTKILWGLAISADPKVFFVIAKTRRKKDPYDAIMLAGSGPQKGRYVAERSPTIAAAKRAGTNTYKHFKKLSKKRKNPAHSGLKDPMNLVALAAGAFLAKKYIK